MVVSRSLLVLLLVSNFTLAENNQTLHAESSSSLALPASRLAIGPAVSFLERQTFYGVDAGISFKVSPSFYLGIISGFYRLTEKTNWSPNANSTTIPSTNNSVPLETSISLVPVLASATFQFPVSQVVRPYAGLAVGGTVAFGHASLTYQGTSYENSGTKLYFTGAVRAGVDFALGNDISLYAEPRAGILDGFMIHSTIGLAVAL